jgi:hypothetical protein
VSRPFIPVPDAASVELIYVMNGETCENVFYVKKGSPYSLADLQALRGTVNTWDAATWAPLRGAYASLVRIRTRARDTASSPAEDFALPTPRAGGQGGVTLPNNATFSIKLVTGLAGRSFRGRLFMVGLTSNYYGADSDHMSILAGSNVLAALNNLLTVLAGAGHTLGVVSYRSNKVFRTVGLFTPALNWTIADYNFDSMRRRLAGRGRP